MNTRVLLGTVGLAGATIFLGQMSVDAGSKSDAGITNGETHEIARGIEIGPDVIVGSLQSTRHWATSGGESS